jgi:hypothetical protein
MAASKAGDADRQRALQRRNRFLMSRGNRFTTIVGK